MKLWNFLCCFCWTSAQPKSTLGCESTGGVDPRSLLPKEEIGPKASKDCQSLAVAAGQEAL